ncbi:PEP-CTERM sorting domain-containing protein [Janthinobacterium sp. NKUCC06_STL]|uniref:PEP-CTERM sorting domain-containing protein n=1 Tax=Janthinobacterium sp. NKUCC06_STL TaxID=2842127 RepID=UPI00214B277E|nr:PEP-CTERM sorting domain-containing protein [Janthinobacterium sp. NKUCC06_STL]
MPTPIFTPASSRPLLLAAALMFFGASVQAQTAAPAQKNEKNCQASTQSANGNTKDANLDGTYSACSLSNGFIGAGTRTNDGTNKTPEFDGIASGQEFRNSSSAENNHRLAARQLPDGAGAGEPRKVRASSDRDFSFTTRDFVASEENRPFDDAAGYRGPGRSYQGRSGDTQAPLIVSSSLGENLPTGSNGVGGGGSGGGFTGGSILPVTPEIPAVPEPETYAMLLAGLGLVALARRRKSK